MSNKIMNQLTLGVSLKDEATFANFYTGKNDQLVAELKKTAHGQGERVIYVNGSGGGGCTHLLQAVCHESNQFQRRSLYLPLNNLSDFSPEILDGLESLDLICIDDIHRISGNKNWEEAFFHTYNRLHDAGKSLIITSNVPPKSLQLLPDIISRLTSGIVFQLQPFSDLEKLEVLIMRADRRGMTLTEDVAKFILTHTPRHMSTLFAALDVLDKVSLAAQRKLTIPFVKSVLQI